MKKFLFVLLITGLTLSACGSATPSAPAVKTQAAAPTAAILVNTVSAPAANSQAAAPTVASAATAVTKKISTVFTPSDPKSVKLAAGKPQLVEFFAFW